MKGSRFLLWLLAGLTGCAHAPSLQTALPPEAGNSPLLYLHATPHRSLYVEVDAVKGAEPSDAELNRLKTVLEEFCDKPDGITIARSSVIPRSAARGKLALAMAQEYLDGPSSGTNAAPSAYLYALFYDNRVNRSPLQSPQVASQGQPPDPIPRELTRSENPHMMPFPYGAMVYVDRSWLVGLGLDKYRHDSLNHEVGHVLGLVRRPSRILARHCPTGGCTMSSVSKNLASDVGAWVKGGDPKSGFCEGCTVELRQFKSATNRSTMHFVGPVLVRTEPAYRVLALPQACCLYVGDALETEVVDFLAGWRKRDPQERCWLNGSCAADRDRALSAVAAAGRDPEEGVRRIAANLERALRAETDQPLPGEPAASDK